MIQMFRGPAARIVAAGGLSFAAHAAAQTSSTAPPPATSLDPVVVTATRTTQPLSDALPATTVITRADIEDSQAPDVPTLLRAQAGFDVTQQGGLGSQSSLFLRGSNSNQVLVLVDGLRINSVESGAASIAHLMIDQIDRIEIVRGNVSSLYGSEAIGGVVQIFTRGGRESDGALAVGASGTWGSERTRAASAEVSQAFGPAGLRTDYGVSASYRSAKGFSAIDADRVATANPDFDGYRNESISAHLAQHVGDSEVGARYFESHGHLDFDETTDYGFIDPTYNGRTATQNERSRQTDATLYARLVPLAPWTIDLSAGQASDLSANTASFPDSFVVGTAVSTQRQYRFGNTIRLDRARVHGRGRAARPDRVLDGVRRRRRRRDVLAARRQRDGRLHRSAVPVAAVQRVPDQRAVTTATATSAARRPVSRRTASSSRPMEGDRRSVERVQGAELQRSRLPVLRQPRAEGRDAPAASRSRCSTRRADRTAARLPACRRSRRTRAT